MKCDWLFSKEPGNFQPGRFLNFGKDGAGVPSDLAGYIYIYGGKRLPGDADGNSLYLARAPLDKLRERESFEFFSGIAAPDQPKWTHDFAAAQPVLQIRTAAGRAASFLTLAWGDFSLPPDHPAPAICAFSTPRTRGGHGGLWLTTQIGVTWGLKAKVWRANPPRKNGSARTA